jgi:hypothetical protein
LLSKVAVLYLAGSGRSGSTLLSRLLELQSGYRSVGETRYIGDAETWSLKCGCGRWHSDCKLWGPVIKRWSDRERLAAWSEANRAAQIDQIRGFLAPHRPPQRLERGLAEVRQVFQTLGGDEHVVVDESKTPWLGYLIAQQPWADVRFVELVRDPREVIGSWQQAKEYLAASPRETMAKHWLRTCLTAEVVRKRTGLPWLRTSYDRLASDPIGVLSAIVGGPVTGLEPADGTVAFENAKVNHIYLSNPDKLRRGPDAVRPPVKDPPTGPPKVGRWEQAAVVYWERFLSTRTELNAGFAGFGAAPQPAIVTGSV